jgi:hypothetical protein
VKVSKSDHTSATLEQDEVFDFMGSGHYPWRIRVQRIETISDGRGLTVTLYGRRIIQKGLGAPKKMPYVDWESNEKLADLVLGMLAERKRLTVGR